LWRAGLRVRAGLRQGGSLRAERDVCVVCDGLGDALRNKEHCVAGAILAKQRNHLATEAADFAIGKNRFEAVADFGPILVVVSGEENQDAAIISFLPHTPLLEQTIREVGRFHAFEGADGDNGDLGICLLLDFGGESVDLLGGGRGDDVGEVVEVVRGAELLDAFGRDELRKGQ
jgi:hypothetical protein